MYLSAYTHMMQCIIDNALLQLIHNYPVAWKGELSLHQRYLSVILYFVYFHLNNHQFLKYGKVDKVPECAAYKERLLCLKSA